MVPAITVPTSWPATPRACKHRARDLDAEIDRRDLRQCAGVVDERRAHAVEQPASRNVDTRAHPCGPWASAFRSGDDAGAPSPHRVRPPGCAVGEHRALVQRPFVGHLALVARRRVAQHHDALDTAGAAEFRSVERAEPGSEIGARAARRRQPLGACGMHRNRAIARNIVAIVAGNHEVAHQRRKMRDEACTQPPDADPRAGRELEVLRDASVEDEALLGVGWSANRRASPIM